MAIRRIKDEPENLMIEEKLSEADQEAETTDIRYTADEIFGKAKEKIK